MTYKLINRLKDYKYALFLFFLANIFDTITTIIGISVGLSEANPSAREASSLVVHKWEFAFIFAVIFVLLNSKWVIKLSYTTLFIVALHNLILLLSRIAQPDLITEHPEVGQLAFMIILSESIILAIIIIYGNTMINYLKSVLISTIGNKNNG